jgi:hypothetical protein
MLVSQSIILIILLAILIGIFCYIHSKRADHKYIASYRWFVKILK